MEDSKVLQHDDKVVDRNKNRSEKRKRPFGESLREAYKSIEFTPLQSTGHPRSPHRFFRESYNVTFPKESSDQPTETDRVVPKFELSQVVHQHVNGLCIVTAGSTRLPEHDEISTIEILVTNAPSCSAAEKRKRQAKMLKGGKVDNVVTPTTILANLHLKSGDRLPIYSCVWGTILEVNTGLSVDRLLDDPLLDGYLAVILPSGEFPPRRNTDRRNECGDEDEDESKRKLARQEDMSVPEGENV